MLFLKIYVGFSLLTFILFELHLHSVAHMAKIKYKTSTADHKDLCGLLFLHIKLFIACFIPLMNMACMYMLMFKSGELEEMYKKGIETSLKRKGEL